MTRHAVCSLVFLVCLVGSVRADQEETVLGKKRSEWLQLLKSAKEPKVRRASLIALEVLGPKTAGVTDGVIEALEMDGDAEVRRDAAQTLGRMGTDAKGAVDALADSLKKDKDGQVRAACARGLGRLAAQVDTQVFILAAALLDPDAGTRAAAAETLHGLGEKARLALPQLLKVLGDPKAERFPRIYAARIMGRFDREAKTTVPVLVSVVLDKGAPPGVRAAAVETLGGLGSAAAEVAASMGQIVLAVKEQAPLRRAAIVALGKIGAKGSVAWPPVKVALKDADTGLRYQAIRLAGSLAREEKTAVFGLTDAALHDGNTENRLAAIQELGQLGAGAAAAVTALGQLSTDSRRSIREAAGAALKKIKEAQ